MDLKNMLHFRPEGIKTYHSESYDRIDPTKTKFDAKGKTILITAGATGIGYSISTAFAAAGVARIIILQRRQAVLDSARQSIEHAYPNTKVETYVASQSDFGRISEVLKSCGQIDILVPCAASAGDSMGKGHTKDTSTKGMTDQYMTNVVGFHHLVKEFLALPTTASGGPKSVIHVSSNASQMYFPGASGYCSSKAAANQILTHFAYDDPQSDVKFYSMHPGAIYTELAAENVPKEAIVWEDIKLPGHFAVWLASPEAEFLNGRFVWAQWDVDELIAMKEKVAADPNLLTISLVK